MLTMLTLLGWGVAGIALLNFVAIAALGVAYVWHDGLRPLLALRRSRQHAFARLFGHSTLDTASMMSGSANAAESWEW